MSHTALHPGFNKTYLPSIPPSDEFFKVTLTGTKKSNKGGSGSERVNETVSTVIPHILPLRIYRQLIGIASPLLMDIITSDIRDELENYINNFTCFVAGVHSIYIQTDLPSIRYPPHIILPNAYAHKIRYKIFNTIIDLFTKKIQEWNAIFIGYFEALTRQKFTFQIETIPDSDGSNLNSEFVGSLFGQPVLLISFADEQYCRRFTISYNGLSYLSIDGMVISYEQYLSDIDDYDNGIDTTTQLSRNIPACQSNAICFFNYYCNTMLKLIGTREINLCLNVDVKDKERVAKCAQRSIIGTQKLRDLDRIINTDSLSGVIISMFLQNGMTSNVLNQMLPVSKNWLNDTLLESWDPDLKANRPDLIPKIKEALLKWSELSSKITTTMKAFFMAELTGLSYSTTPECWQEIKDLQNAALSIVLPQDLIVFKTSRQLLFDNFDSQSNLEIGKSYPQYVFNSTTIDIQFDTRHFSDQNQEIIAFVIHLPKGTKCGYLGTDKTRTKYVSEYELLLPIGGKFRIVNILRNFNVQHGNTFYRCLYYIVKYEPPESDFTNFKDRLPIEKLTAWARQDNAPLEANLRDAEMEIMTYFRRVLWPGISAKQLDIDVQRLSRTHLVPKDKVLQLLQKVATMKKINLQQLRQQNQNIVESPSTHITFGDDYNQPTDNLSPVTHITFDNDYNQPTDNLPAYVTHVRFGFSYNQPTNKLPASVTHVTFGYMYNQLTNNLPASVTHVTFGDNYNRSTDNLPASVTHVTFGFSYNQPTDNLPASVTHVTFGNNYDQPTDHLPASVTHVTFGDDYNQLTDKLPESVTHVTFGYYYNQPTDNLPGSVTHITFGYYYNQLTDNLPAAVTHVIFGDDYNKPTNNLPSSVTHVTFGEKYDQPTNNLPASVTHVTFGHNYNQPTDNLPAAITHVTFGDMYNHPTDHLPASVMHVTFGEEYDQLTDKLPTSATRVTFGDEYNQPTDNLPASVTHIIFGWNYNQPTDNLPSAVTHVTFGYKYNQLTDNLPASITHVTFGDKYDQPTNNLPPAVINVIFGDNYNHPLDRLPASVKEVEIGKNWNYNVNSIPEHVKIVKSKLWDYKTYEYKYKILR
jgi:hypothetical protein